MIGLYLPMPKKSVLLQDLEPFYACIDDYLMKHLSDTEIAHDTQLQFKEWCVFFYIYERYSYLLLPKYELINRDFERVLDWIGMRNSLLTLGNDCIKLPTLYNDNQPTRALIDNRTLVFYYYGI